MQQMERFKACEKEMKTKAFSKEGLSAAARLDPSEKAKVETAQWLSSMVDELSRQIEATEAEMEQALSTTKKGKKGSMKDDRVGTMEHQNERRNWHISRLEILLRMLENGTLEPERANEIKDDIAYFVESNAEEEFEEDEGIYDEFNLEEEEGAFGLRENEDGASPPAEAGSAEAAPAPAPEAPGAPAGGAPKPKEKEPAPKPAEPKKEEPAPPKPKEEAPSKKKEKDSKKGNSAETNKERVVLATNFDQGRVQPASAPVAPRAAPAAPLPPVRYATAAAAAVASPTSAAAQPAPPMALPADGVAAVEELLRGGGLDVLVVDGGPAEGVTGRRAGTRRRICRDRGHRARGARGRRRRGRIRAGRPGAPGRRRSSARLALGPGLVVRVRKAKVAAARLEPGTCAAVARVELCWGRAERGGLGEPQVLCAKGVVCHAALLPANARVGVRQPGTVFQV